MEPDELYGLPLERFVPERDTLARALRAERRRDDAARVAALRKPSVAAWAVNQLVRTQRPAVAELLAAGDAVRAAQAELIAGRGDPRALRAAGERERAAVDGLVATARGLIDAEGRGLSAVVVERVGETLHAAALDEQARSEVRDGRLARELRHAGLGLGLGLGTGGGGSASEAAAEHDAAKRAAAAERAARERTEREAAERERTERRAEARAAELAARRRAERAARALRAAEQRRERAAAALDAADAALEEARVEAAAADAEHDAATRRTRG